MANQQPVTSTGHRLSDAGSLDIHFEVNGPEYTRLVERAGFEQGWHVLDAGCGSGSFLPILAGQLGPDGKLAAVDLAPENVAISRERLEQWDLPCPVEVQESSVLDLPFPDDTFDAIWCANVSQYLTDEELDGTLREFMRVSRPGGLIVIKETASIFTLFEPAPPSAKQLLVAEVARNGSVQARGVIRSWNLCRFLDRAGLTGVEQDITLIEHRAPLGPIKRQAFGTLLAQHADIASKLSLPDEYATFWARQRDPANPEVLVNHPDFYFAEGQVMATGRMP